MEKLTDYIIEHSYMDEDTEIEYVVRKHLEPEIYTEFIAKNKVGFTIGMIIKLIKKYSDYHVDPLEFTFKLGDNAKIDAIVNGITRFTIDDCIDEAIIIY